ncbi:hypothetical protein IC620_09680 [Hazenella sp. IB182357]|uniref:Uncharacterized protein n=1 Tax=Polycladospora coralii TaxID=2771432 RepID=A0A926NA45_9BACL|nr:hypothetical protein [Polycladospora coralii]MBD1372623.1 hypothetical protein [Polycladospora coralii]MBS7531269.1 hypothetical protein [Polycladospora coralii]
MKNVKIICDWCNGTKKIDEIKDTGRGWIKIPKTCDACKGKGYKVS